MNDTGAHPLGKRVLIRRDEGEKKIGMIHVPDGLERWPQTGVVLEVGPLVDDPEIAVGRRVLFQPQPASALWWDDRFRGCPKVWERVIRIDQDNVLGIVEE